MLQHRHRHSNHQRPDGAAGADVVDVAGAVTTSTIYGGSANDRVVVTGDITDSLIQTSTGNNSYALTGDTSKLTLNGGSGTDSLLLTGASSSDAFTMGDGKDTLKVTSNVDATIKMGAGNIIDIAGTATGTFYLGTGDDTITINDAATSEALIQSGLGTTTSTLLADSITVILAMTRFMQSAMITLNLLSEMARTPYISVSQVLPRLKTLKSSSREVTTLQ